MRQEVTLFLSMFTTLLAIINPLEALPVFLTLLEGKDDEYHRRVARRACSTAMSGWQACEALWPRRSWLPTASLHETAARSSAQLPPGPRRRARRAPRAC